MAWAQPPKTCARLKRWGKAVVGVESEGSVNSADITYRFPVLYLCLKYGCVSLQGSEGGERQRVMCVELIANRFLRRVSSEFRS